MSTEFAHRRRIFTVASPTLGDALALWMDPAWRAEEYDQILDTAEIRRFVMLVIVSNLVADKPQELLRLSVVRARFCELLAEHGSLAGHSAELFLLGLFSLIDAILDKIVSGTEAMRAKVASL